MSDGRDDSSGKGDVEGLKEDGADDESGGEEDDGGYNRVMVVGLAWDTDHTVAEDELETA